MLFDLTDKFNQGIWYKNIQDKQIVDIIDKKYERLIYSTLGYFNTTR